MPRSNEESQIQRALLSYIAYSAPEVFVFHVPNGGKRNPKEAANLKKDGVKAGVADLCIMYPNGKTLFLELKSAKGSQKQSQKDFEVKCKVLGHAYDIAFSIDDGIEIINHHNMRWLARKK